MKNNRFPFKLLINCVKLWAFNRIKASNTFNCNLLTIFSFCYPLFSPLLPHSLSHSHSIRFQCDFHRQFYTLLTLFNFSQSHSTVTQFSNIFFTSYSHPKQKKQKTYSWLIEKNWWCRPFACGTVSVLVLKNFNKFSHANRPKVNLQLDKVQ